MINIRNLDRIRVLIDIELNGEQLKPNRPTV